MSVRRPLLAATAPVLAVIGILALPAHAEDGPHDKSIKARQALMQLYSYHLGMLSDMVKGKRDYDAELATEAASNLSTATSLGQSTLWPEGSDSETAGNAETRALPDIWSTYPAIAEKGQALSDAVPGLVSAAGGGVDALEDAVGDVGGACKGCHDDFRAEKDG